MTTSAAGDEDWAELAARDDALVAELLLRLCRNPAHAPPALKLDWTVRQPRTGGPKKNEKIRKKKNNNNQKGDVAGVEPTRASPTTPLSWSGATSTSGGAGDGPEESSRPPRPPYNARSKVSVCTANAKSATSAAKKPKRKKTLVELKEEESVLLKERRNLRHQLAALRLTLEQEQAKNEIFKRKKLYWQLQHEATSVKADHEPLEVLPKGRDNQRNPPADYISTTSRVEMRELMFQLPDLNEPLEEHCGP